MFTFALRPNGSGLKRETDGVVPLNRDGQDGQHTCMGDGQLHEGDKVAHRLKNASHGGKKLKTGALFITYQAYLYIHTFLRVQ